MDLETAKTAGYAVESNAEWGIAWSAKLNGFWDLGVALVWAGLNRNFSHRRCQSRCLGRVLGIAGFGRAFDRGWENS